LTYFDKYRNILGNLEVSLEKKQLFYFLVRWLFLRWEKINVLFAQWRFSVRGLNGSSDFFLACCQRLGYG